MCLCDSYCVANLIQDMPKYYSFMTAERVMCDAIKIGVHDRGMRGEVGKETCKQEMDN